MLYIFIYELEGRNRRLVKSRVCMSVLHVLRCHLECRNALYLNVETGKIKFGGRFAFVCGQNEIGGSGASAE